ncbi:Serine/threonine-protein kinase Nek7 (Never in mitosis A-related kinase 7) (NimA-related protein kinase 7) [Durusdinium trenchii]|uniref:non-specific serine/threonine protein kinase n=1 Tax=Durusdinium trenchii TaxID=1381693 RepID=A0ABP0L667_9DINO
MATFRFIHAESGWPLHIDGLGDKLASLRYGDCRDDFSAFWIEPAGEGRVYLRNLATELPLHINGLGDQLASVRCGDCMDDYSQFYLCTAPFPSQSTPDGLLLLSVAMGRALRIGADRMASTMEEGDIPSGYEMVGAQKNTRENEAFLRTELVNLAHLPSHPNLLRYYTCFLEKGRLHIVTEFLDAVKLYHLIKGSKASPSPAESVSCWFLQLFKGLSCLHSIGMIHRDLHAENVLISRDERREVSTCPSAVKIIDVGLSKISELLEPSVMSVKGVGPAWYFSPERRAGEAFDHLDDVWAAGCMLAEMIISEGCYIQNCPSHGPGGIDFSSRPQAVEKLLQLCETSSAAVGRVPRKALAKRIHRALAGQMAELLEDVSKSAGGAVMWRGTGRCFWGLKVDRGSLRFWVSSCAFSRWYRPAIPSGQSILFLYSYCTVMYVLSS